MVGKVTIDPEKCRCPARCVQSCPQDVLDWDFENRKAVVVNEIECFVCYNCMEVCPYEAITVKEVDWNPPSEN